MKIVTIIGARPQFIKAAALSRVFREYPDIEEVLVHTGQHFDENMSDVFFNDMDIPKPKYNLAINSLGHGAMTGRMLEGIEELLLTEKPDLLLVYGDTNSTLAGALAAKKLHIPVGHVEAGLRSFNMEMPEEINRILTDRISDLLFCPTNTAIENLSKEGYDHFENEIVKSGDVMQDAALFYAQTSHEKANLPDNLPLGGFTLCTLHRAENTDDEKRLNALVTGINRIHTEQNPVVIPLHPRTKSVLDKTGIKLDCIVIPPVGYFEMVELLKKSSVVMTDSGGLQKEAFFFAKGCITMRDQTEWVELVEHGFNVLVGADTDALLREHQKMIESQLNFEVNLYGNGKAAHTIAKALLKHFTN